MEPEQDNKASAPSAPTPAAKPRSKFSRIVWGIIGLAAIALGASQLYSALKGMYVLPDCDLSPPKTRWPASTRSTISSRAITRRSRPFQATRITSCATRVLPLPDGVNLIADYDFFWEGNTVKVKYSMHRKAP